MSFNQSLKQQKQLDLELQKRFLKENRQTKNSLLTLRKRVVAESKTVNFKEHKKKLKDLFLKATKFSEIIIEDLVNNEEYIEFLKKETIVYSDKYQTTLREYFNEIEIKKLNILGKIKDIEKKLSALKTFNLGAKFCFIENFNSLYNISRELINVEALNVDCESKVLTLPVKDRRNIKIKNIFISKESNGIPGDLEGKNKFIYNIIDNNDNSYFESSRKDNGPLILQLGMQLNEKEVVNEIQIEALQNTDIEVSDIWFSTDESSSVSIKRLVSENYQSFKFTNGKLKIVHLPIEAEQIGITFKSNEYSIFENEKRFYINLKSLRIARNEYNDEGKINSVPIGLEGGYTSGIFHTKVYPSKSDSYIEGLNLSENAEAQKENYDLNENKTRNFPVKNTSKEVVFKYKLRRNNEVSSLKPYMKKKLYANVQSKLNRFTKNISPNNISFKENVAEDNIKLIQPDVFVRSVNKNKRVRLKLINNSGISIVELPEKLKSFNIKESEIEIYLNDSLGSAQESIQSVDAINKYFINNNKDVHIFNNADTSLKVEVLIKPAIRNLIKTKEGFYISINENFVYDKQTIECKITSPTSEEKVRFLEKNINVFFLEENIESLVFEQLQGDSWSVIDPTEYTIDVVNGILRTNSSLDALEKRISYKYQEQLALKKDDFEIWKKDKQIKGLFFKEEVFSFEEKENTINLNDGNFFTLQNENIIDGSLRFEENFFDEAIEQVAYINGYNEFLNVKYIEKDYIPRIETTGSITIPLIEIPTLSNGFGINDIVIYNAKGEKQVNLNLVVNNNLLTISNLTAGVLENWYVSYYFLEEEPISKLRYSINTEDGRVYLSKNKTIENKSIYYQQGFAELGYSLYKNIEEFTFDKDARNIEFNTENLLDVNNKVKILWEEVDEEISFENLKNFYSPLVYEFSLELN